MTSQLGRPREYASCKAPLLYQFVTCSASPCVLNGEPQDVGGALVRLPTSADGADAELRAAPVRGRLDAAAAAVDG